MFSRRQEEKGFSGGVLSRFAEFVRRVALNGPNARALSRAVQDEDLDKVRWILSASRPFYIPEESQHYTPLRWAVTRNNVECVRMLLSCNEMPPSRVDITRALFSAALNGRADCARLLIEKSADISAISDIREGESPLMAAASGGDAQIIRWLLPKSDPALVCPRGKTALLFAATHGRSEAIALLLPLSDLSVRDEDGWSALMHAARSGSLESVRLLLPKRKELFNDPEVQRALNCAKPERREELISLIESKEIAEEAAQPTQAPVSKRRSAL